MCCPPHRGQAFHAGSWGKFAVRFRVWYGQATGTNLQIWCAKFEIFLSKSCGMLLYHDFCKPLRSTYLLLLWWLDHLRWQPARAHWHSHGKRVGEGVTWAALGSCAPLGCCPVQEHIHLGCSHLLPTPVTSPGIPHMGIQGCREACKKVPWAKCMLWLSVCSHRTWQIQSSQAHWSMLAQEDLKVCCLNINKVGVSVSSAGYKLVMSLSSWCLVCTPQLRVFNNLLPAGVSRAACGCLTCPTH